MWAARMEFWHMFWHVNAIRERGVGREGRVGVAVESWFWGRPTRRSLGPVGAVGGGAWAPDYECKMPK